MAANAPEPDALERLRSITPEDVDVMDQLAALYSEIGRWSKVIEVLNEIGNADSVKDLLEAIKDDDWWVRARAGDALAEIGGAAAVRAGPPRAQAEDRLLALVVQPGESLARNRAVLRRRVRDTLFDADGRFRPTEERRERWAEHRRATMAGWSPAPPTPGSTTRCACASVAGAKAAEAARATGFAEVREELAAQAALVRDIFGNPFRPAELRREWLRNEGAAVAPLAESIAAEQRYEDMPILGDALEDAGCTDAGILAHLRGPGPHARGCWPLDLILSKDR